MKKILIVENKKSDQEMIRQHFQNSFSQFDAADSGENAFYLINKNDYDLIVISNDLPDLNGIWIVQHLKKRLETDIILTSHFNHELVEKQARKLNVGFLKKPIK
ncbi:MAG: response regulator [Candidatus Cloacimonetes bacterium]|nr:response regulator [Candidatus Cloacimonadota bacterium]